MIRLDIQGKVCPNATGDVYAALRDLPEGETLEVVSNYAPARATIPALVRQFGGACDVAEDDGHRFTMVIRKPGETAPA